MLDRLFDRLLCWARVHRPHMAGRRGDVLVIACRRWACGWAREESI